MKKVLAVIGSPKGKGNSYKVTKKLEKEMNTLGKFDFEYLFLKDYNIEMCRGCFSCVRKGQKFCPLTDDIEIIKEKMHKSDGVIFVSPRYCQNVTGIMKNFIDRLSYLFHRPEFFNQKALHYPQQPDQGLKKHLNIYPSLKFGDSAL